MHQVFVVTFVTYVWFNNFQSCHWWSARNSCWRMGFVTSAAMSFAKIRLKTILADTDHWAGEQKIHRCGLTGTKIFYLHKNFELLHSKQDMCLNIWNKVWNFLLWNLNMKVSFEKRYVVIHSTMFQPSINQLHAKVTASCNKKSISCFCVIIFESQIPRKQITSSKISSVANEASRKLPRKENVKTSSNLKQSIEKENAIKITIQCMLNIRFNLTLANQSTSSSCLLSITFYHIKLICWSMIITNWTSQHQAVVYLA